MRHFLRAQLLLRVFSGHHDKVTVVLESGQRVPGCVHNQRVARLKCHAAHTIALPEGLAPAMQRDQRDTVGLAHPDVASGTANQSRVGWDDEFRYT